MKKTLLLFLFIFAAAASQACPFCQEKILKAQGFYESETVIALIPSRPAGPGHVLVLPKRHIERFEELTDQEMIEIKEATRKIDAMAQKMFHNQAYMFVQKNGVAAGQSVPHMHFHYLPRYNEEGHIRFGIRYLISRWFKSAKPPEEIEKQAAIFRLQLE
ncbi:MAG TPA: HIT domain-containing protein [Chlamydiales bacterium]|nr:HIT domain-containing protein [Chlamydiales bacterium]